MEQSVGFNCKRSIAFTSSHEDIYAAVQMICGHGATPFKSLQRDFWKSVVWRASKCGGSLGRKWILVVALAVPLQGWAETLVATRPGLMCSSAAALATLTLPDGSDRSVSLRAHGEDLATKRIGGCVDISIGVHVVLQTMRIRTSIVTFDAQDGQGPRTFFVPNIDFEKVVDSEEQSSPHLAPSPPQGTMSQSGASATSAETKSIPSLDADKFPKADSSLKAQPKASAPIADAPQELLYQYLQSKNLSILDAGILDAYAASFMQADFLAATGNEIKKDILRHRALSIIKEHHVERRLKLGMIAIIGNYDVERHRFPILYPMYGAAAAVNPSAAFRNQTRGLPDLLNHPFSADVDHQGWSCSYSPVERFFSDFSAESYFEVAPGCEQNTRQTPTRLRMVNLNSLAGLFPRIFKLRPNESEDWNYLDMGPDDAVKLIDRLNDNRVNRKIWTELVFDTLSMDSSTPDRVVSFAIHPIAIFAWNFPPYRAAEAQQGKSKLNFLFAKGSVTTHEAPVDGILRENAITSISVAKPTITNMSLFSCPPDLPEDAAVDKCSDQRSLVAAGMYLSRTGHVRPLSTTNNSPKGHVGDEVLPTTVPDKSDPQQPKPSLNFDKSPNNPN